MVGNHAPRQEGRGLFCADGRGPDRLRFKSSSKSSQRQTSNVEDRRIGATDHAIIAAEGSKVVSSDPEVVKAALEEGRRVAETAMDTVQEAQENALGEAFGFGNEALTLTADALAEMGITARQALELVEEGGEKLADTTAASQEQVAAALEQNAQGLAGFKQVVAATAIVGGLAVVASALGRGK